MPELPEVEILRMGLNKYILGLTISDIEVRSARCFQGEVALSIGGKVKAVRRFGKMLAIDLSNGISLAIHVKMTGRLIYRGKKQPKNIDVDDDLVLLPGKHTHVIFIFSNGDRLYFNDVRKFGWIRIIRTKDVERLPFVQQLGPEPFKNLTRELFYSILQRYSRPIKTLIMDQQRIAGVGNIYANEALFHAKILPSRKSSMITEEESRVLYNSINLVLEEGMKYGGSSVDSFRDILGQQGSYQKRYFVYDRGKLLCRRKGCRGKITKSTLSGRGTYFCPVCQR